MKILALNSGSSSIKYRLFDGSKNYQLIGQGLAERVGQKNSSISQVIKNKRVNQEIALPDYQTAMHALFLDKDIEQIDAVGHRVVHGGELFKNPTLITREVVKEIKKLSTFAPLHCQPNVTGIEVLQKMFPDIPHVAVFDTSAHAAMDSKAYLYGLPMEYYEKYGIRKYGFHGINHSYVALEAARLLQKPLEHLKVITCHLGNGCSVTAFEKGRSIDTSMGLTPLEGLVMGTRCGDLDPSIIVYLMEEHGLKIEQIKDLLNKKSGLLGLCGKSDMRDIIACAEDGEKNSQVAIDIFVYRIQKYIGAYIAALNGVDVIVFTGGIGENSSYVRSLILKNFSYLDVIVKTEENEKNHPIFSGDNSRVFLMNIPANEEKVIAQETYDFINKEGV